MDKENDSTQQNNMALGFMVMKQVSYTQYKWCDFNKLHLKVQ